VFDSHENNKFQLERTDADGSNPTILGENAFNSDCSPDGKWVMFSSENKIWRRPVDGGKPVQFFSANSAGMGVISPDGKWVAVTYQETAQVPTSKIAMIPAEGGSPAHEFRRPLGAGGLHWAPDGKGVQYGLTRRGASNIWEQSLAGGDPHPVTDFTSGHIFDFAWSRDGKQLLLARGEESSDVVLLSNFR
jgi:Tol biopolymer transport system component